MELGDRVARLIGLDPARDRYDFREVQGWLNAGAQPALILEVVAEVMARPNLPASVNLRYVGFAVRDALAKGRKAAVVVPADGVSDLSAFGRAYLAWKGHRQGPMPVRADFAA